jgi:hypothetical protein
MLDQNSYCPDLDNTTEGRYRYDWVVILLIGTIALCCGWLYRDFAQDDAFITYRYARNIASGYGFVYNLNEPVLGTTTPLYTLVLALFGKHSGQDIRLISHLISVLSLWISGVVLYYLGKGGGILQAAAVALVFVSNPLLISAIGMETLFLIAVLLLALKSYVDEKFYMTGVLLGFLTLTRYETMLFVGLLGLHYLLKHRKLPIWLASTVAIFGVWTVFAWYTFGNVIPQSALAKVTVLTSGDGYPFYLGAIMWWLVYGFQSSWYYVLVPIALLGGYLAVRRKRHEQGYVLILAWSGLYFIAASLIAGSFSWYFGPLIPGFAILLVWGIEFLVRLLGRLFSQIHFEVRLAQTTRAIVFVVMALGIVILQLSSWTKGWVTYRGQIVDVRYVHYREVAKWLDHYASRDETLATREIGVLGYYTDMKIIDLYGLVTPDLMSSLARGETEALRKTVELYAPDYLLMHQREPVDESLGYEPAQRFGEGAYMLYRKK